MMGNGICDRDYDASKTLIPYAVGLQIHNPAQLKIPPQLKSNITGGYSQKNSVKHFVNKCKRM